MSAAGDRFQRDPRDVIVALRRLVLAGLVAVGASALLGLPVLVELAILFAISLFVTLLAGPGRESATARASAEEERRRLSDAIEDRTRDLTRSEAALDSVRTRLAASDRLAAIGTVAAGVAHDIRNPVAALRAALDEAPSLIDETLSGGRAGATYDVPALLRSAIDDARDACDHLQRLVGDLTSLARTTPALPVAVPCRLALESAARLLRHRVKAPVSLVVRCTTDASLIADPGRLQQVLLNLGANALDAMDGTGGCLTLEARAAAEGWVRLSVEDTGVGMSDEIAAKALAGFFTTKPAGKGTGLGLHLVREITQAHGARIELVSKRGCGTTFSIEWPAERISDPAGEMTHEHHHTGSADRRRRGEHSSGPRAHAPA